VPPVDAVDVIPPAYACVVAADVARGIGRGNELPWPRLPGDVAHFKSITTKTRDPAKQNAVIMGRKTWDSVPPRYRPLSGRINVVVSRSVHRLDGATVAPGLDEAVAAATAAGAESIFVVGGGQLYALAVEDPRCAVLYYTDITGRFDCDTVFPAFRDQYQLEAADPPRTDGEVTYTIQRWRRRDM